MQTFQRIKQLFDQQGLNRCINSSASAYSCKNICRET